ncbi:unnamed protein product, partial [Hapterophycus canaliculatus]
RPENVEVFHKRHKEQEAEYRHKVHQGKETLKKTSQGTDAMYNFVLKLNLATTEGKARFMKKWAIGRIANGETVSPREGWKFLQSLGIGVQKVSPSPAASASANPVSPAGDDAAEIRSAAKPAAATVAAAAAAAGAAAGAGAAPAAATAATAAPFVRGRGRTRNLPAARAGPKGESAAWEVAMSQAVGAVVRVDPDACAPKLAFHRRRRSGSEPRKTPNEVPRAPETCRAPKSKSFFFSNSSSSSETVNVKESAQQQPNADPRARRSSFNNIGSGSKGGGFGFLEEDEGELDDFVRDLSVSPAGSCLLGQRPQSQAFGARGPSLDSFRASVSSSRMSLSPAGPPDLSPERR